MEVVRAASSRAPSNALRPLDERATDRLLGSFSVLALGALGVGAAALVAASFARFGWTAHAVVASCFAVIVLALAAIDIERRIVPNRIVLPATAIILAAQVALSPDRTLEWTAAALGAALFLLLPLLIYPSGMGMGDVKLALLLGAGLGWAVVPAFVVGLLAAFVAAVVVLARGGLSARKTALPFVPFLAAGALVALFVG
jgi:leader peptidase (prepilin peptidase)/N-methyltransferase